MIIKRFHGLLTSHQLFWCCTAYISPLGGNTHLWPRCLTTTRNWAAEVWNCHCTTFKCVFLQKNKKIKLQLFKICMHIYACTLIYMVYAYVYHRVRNIIQLENWHAVFLGQYLPFFKGLQFAQLWWSGEFFIRHWLKVAPFKKKKREGWIWPLTMGSDIYESPSPNGAGEATLWLNLNGEWPCPSEWQHPKSKMNFQ